MASRIKTILRNGCLGVKLITIKMSESIIPNEYKQQLITDFNSRKNYDKGQFKIPVAKRLITLAKLQRGQQVLDVATGTGLVALMAAKIVAPGQVIGIDISTGMLQQAEQKLLAECLQNVEFLEADAEHLSFNNNSFDIILCSLALCYLTDIPAALKKWYSFLKPGGTFAFNCWAESAFEQSILFREVAGRYGIKIPNPHEPLGTVEKCYKLLQEAGYKNIEVHTEQFGWYYTPDANCAESNWQINATNVFGFQVCQLSPEKLARCKAEYLAKIQVIPVTKQGAWCDAKIFLVMAQK